MKKLIEKADRFLVIYAQDSRNTDRFDIEYKSHLYNSRWFQYMEDQNDFELIYEQEKPFDESLCSAQFFVFERINK
jgi:ribosomal protein L30E